MTRRTNTTKETIYRRHAGRCPIKGQPNNITQCECPLWIQGKVRGEFLRESFDRRTLSTAEMRQTNVERGCPLPASRAVAARRLPNRSPSPFSGKLEAG